MAVCTRACVYAECVIEAARTTRLNIFYIGEGNDLVPRNARYFRAKKRARSYRDRYKTKRASPLRRAIFNLVVINLGQGAVTNPEVHDFVKYPFTLMSAPTREYGINIMLATSRVVAR